MNSLVLRFPFPCWLNDLTFVFSLFTWSMRLLRRHDQASLGSICLLPFTSLWTSRNFIIERMWTSQFPLQHFLISIFRISLKCSSIIFFWELNAYLFYRFHIAYLSIFTEFILQRSHLTKWEHNSCTLKKSKENIA